MSKDHGNVIYIGMITFLSFSAFYLNLQAMIEKQLGWFSFSVTQARNYSITIHADCCKGTISSLARGHIHSQQIDSPLRKRQQLPDSSSRLVSIWLFQQQVLHQQCCTRLKITTVDELFALGRACEHKDCGVWLDTAKGSPESWIATLCSQQLLPSTFSDAPRWLWWTLYHKYEAGNREEQKSRRDRICQVLSQTFYWTPYGKLSLLTE